MNINKSKGKNKEKANKGKIIHIKGKCHTGERPKPQVTH